MVIHRKEKEKLEGQFVSGVFPVSSAFSNFHRFFFYSFLYKSQFSCSSFKGQSSKHTFLKRQNNDNMTIFNFFYLTIKSIVAAFVSRIQILVWSCCCSKINFFSLHFPIFVSHMIIYLSLVLFSFFLLHFPISCLVLLLLED